MVSKFYWLGYQTTRKQTSNFFYIEFLTSLAPTACLSGSCLTWKGLIIGGLKTLKGTTPLNRATTDSESQELSYHEHWLHNEVIILQVSLCIHVVCDEFLNFSKFSISRQIFYRTICVFCTVLLLNFLESFKKNSNKVRRREEGTIIYRTRFVYVYKYVQNTVFTNSAFFANFEQKLLSNNLAWKGWLSPANDPSWNI